MSYSHWLVSGYSSPEGSDLLLIRMQSDSGRLEFLSGMRIDKNPSFLCCGQSGIYAAQEYDSGASILQINKKGDQLTIGAQMNIDGAFGLCHLLSCGDMVVGSCYGNGDVFAVDADLTSVRWQKQNGDKDGETSHAHWSTLINEQVLCCADLGLDALLWRQISDGKLLSRTALEAGSGPRQAVMSIDGRLAYIINELNSTISLLDITGLPRIISTMRTTGHEVSNYPANACLSGDGLLYVANRGANTIAAIDLEGTNPRIVFEVDCGGTWPRWITLSAREDFLMCCNQKSDNVVNFRITKSSLEMRDNISLANAACAVAVDDYL